MPEFVMPDLSGSWTTKEAADAAVARYEADRCACGGSPWWADPHTAVHRADCRAPVLVEVEALKQEISPGEWVFDTGLCYLCGQSNYAASHCDANGFPTRCPLGITREQADAIRRGWLGHA
jgi:hypothetical protein